MSNNTDNYEIRIETYTEDNKLVSWENTPIKDKLTNVTRSECVDYCRRLQSEYNRKVRYNVEGSLQGNYIGFTAMGYAHYIPAYDNTGDTDKDTIETKVKELHKAIDISVQAINNAETIDRVIHHASIIVELGKQVKALQVKLIDLKN